MAHLLKYKNDFEIISPISGGVFTPEEIKDYLKVTDYCIYNLRGHDKKPTPYRMAYDPALMGQIRRFNYLASKTILKSEFSESQYTAVTIQLRTAPAAFFERNKNLTFISGFAIVGTAFELKL